MKNHQLSLSVVLCTLIFLTCSPSEPVSPHQRITAVITAHIKGPQYKGNFYKGFLPQTDYAFWIENSVGDYITTLRLSKGVVNVAKTGIHAGHLPVWQKITGTTSTATVADDSLAYILPQFDGLTSASLKVKPSADTVLSLLWDFTDTAGREVPEGEYYLCLETANIQKDSIPGAAYVPAKINSEKTSALINTRRRLTQPATATAGISALSVTVIPHGVAPGVPIDGTTSATE